MSEKGHIVFVENSRTVQQENKWDKNVENVDGAEGSFRQVDEGLTGPYHTAIPKRRADAWVPDNN